jgi:DNA polymerase-1
VRLKTRTRTNKKIADSIAEAKAALKWPSNYVICQDVRDLGRVARDISKHRKFAFDTETSGLNPWGDKLSCLSLYVGGTAYLVNFRHPLLPQISYREFKDVLGPYFSDPNVERIGFNVAFDYHFLEEQAGVPCGEMSYDGSIAVWLLSPDEPEKGLKPLCEKYLGTTGSSYAEQFGKTDWTVIDPQVAAYYALHDSELHWKWYEYTERELKKAPELHKLMHELEMPVANVYYETEREGFLVDLNYLQNDLASKMKSDLGACAFDVLACAHKALGYSWSGDLDKPNDVADLLFNRLRLPRVKGDSTDKGVMVKLKDRHPIIPLLSDYRATYKLKTAFVDSLPELVVKHVQADGSVVYKVHPNFRVIGSETGRTSCSDPNILQMPARTGNTIRRAFMAGPGYYLVSKDFSGQELRIQAALSGDLLLKEIVNTGGDIYSETAAVFYGGVSADYTKTGPKKKERDKGKAAVLALSYGASEFKMAEIFECSVERAKAFITDFFKRFPGLKKLADQAKEFAKKHGYVQTVLGRRRPARYLPGMTPQAESALDRLCANTPIQGTAADQIKLAIVLCDRHLKAHGYKTRVLTGIHDEILFRAWADEWDYTDLPEELSYIMEHCLEFPGIPMKTSAEVYPERWGETEIPPPDPVDVALELV